MVQSKICAKRIYEGARRAVCTIHSEEPYGDSFPRVANFSVMRRRKMQPFMFGTLLTQLTCKKPMTYKELTREIF